MNAKYTHDIGHSELKVSLQSTASIPCCKLFSVESSCPGQVMSEWVRCKEETLLEGLGTFTLSATSANGFVFNLFYRLGLQVKQLTRKALRLNKEMLRHYRAFLGCDPMASSLSTMQHCSFTCILSKKVSGLETYRKLNWIQMIAPDSLVMFNARIPAMAKCYVSCAFSLTEGDTHLLNQIESVCASIPDKLNEKSSPSPGIHLPGTGLAL